MGVAPDRMKGSRIPFANEWKQSDILDKTENQELTEKKYKSNIEKDYKLILI